jgi:DNA-binding response OmpR family regulator
MSGQEEQRILIVDDEGTLARLMQMVLEYLGYAVDWAEDGEKALMFGQQHEYAAVICDILMPIVNGMELFEIWQEQAPELAARVIFVTGGNLGSRTNRFIELCGRPCLYKPFDMKELTNTLHEVTEAWAS